MGQTYIKAATRLRDKMASPSSLSPISLEDVVEMISELPDPLNAGGNTV
jgi:hypothetical protein